MAVVIAGAALATALLWSRDQIPIVLGLVAIVAAKLGDREDDE